MTGGIYRSEFEAMKALHIMRRCVSYIRMINGKTGDNRRSVARVFTGKNKLLAKCFGKNSECYVDVGKVQLTFFFFDVSKELLKDNKGNFLYHTTSHQIRHCFRQTLKLSKGSPKYLSPLIQNELISVLAEEVLRDIKSELQSAPFFAIILDTTQDISKKDRLREVFCYVKINYHDDGTPSELKVVEAFTSFIKVKDSSAIGLHKLIINSIQQKGLDIKYWRE